MNYKNLLLPLLLLLGMISCHKEEPLPEDEFTYPSSKIWAHQVDDTNDVKIIQNLYDGLELNLNYSEYQNKLFVCHDLQDTIKNVTFHQWLSSLENPQKNWYWLDCKNISPQNAKAFASIIKQETVFFNITNKVLVESYSLYSLQIVKKYDLHVLLGVANFTALPDTLQWYNETASNIATLEPWGISCDYTMFPSLSDSFPDKKIHFWNTPQTITPSVEQKTIDMENTPNVKVVLVDYTIIK